MSWHLAAYTGLIGQTANTDIAALSDDELTIANGHFQLWQPMQLVWAMAMSATLNRARLDSGTLRFYGQPYVRPIVRAAVPGNDPNIFSLYDKPVFLPQGEEIAMQATSGIAMGTEQFTGLIALADTIEPMPAGNVYPVRFTSTTAAVANAWTTITYALETGLPAGRYAALFSEVQSTNAQAHRWIGDVQKKRPGFPSVTSLANRTQGYMYRFPMGQMFQFNNTALPRLQVLVNGTDAAHEGYLWITPLGRAA